MGKLADYEYLTFAITLAVLWLAVETGAWIARVRPIKEEQRGHLGQVTGVSLSILALIVGFSFSAAIGRYDERKHDEQEEASAISTEYNLVGLLPEADAAQIRAMLEEYVRLRITFYEAANRTELTSVRTHRLELEDQMWPIVERNARARQTPVINQVMVGMVGVLNRPGYSQAAAWDRIPDGAWTLMAILAFLSSMLLGYSGQGRHTHAVRLVLPVFVALAFYFIASLDTQRRGLIRVHPQNLIRLQADLDAKHKP
jgi:hypothetical protein